MWLPIRSSTVLSLASNLFTVPVEPAKAAMLVFQPTSDASTNRCNSAESRSSRTESPTDNVDIANGDDDDDDDDAEVAEVAEVAAAGRSTPGINHQLVLFPKST